MPSSVQSKPYVPETDEEKGAFGAYQMSLMHAITPQVEKLEEMTHEDLRCGRPSGRGGGLGRVGRGGLAQGDNPPPRTLCGVVLVPHFVPHLLFVQGDSAPTRPGRCCLPQTGSQRLALALRVDSP